MRAGLVLLSIGCAFLAELLCAPAFAQAGTARVYVRRIEFTGAAHIDDEVLRRELLQLEGGYLNTIALDRSLERLERLPFVASADATLHPVNGDTSLVDIEIRIVEAPARRYGFGGGYSPALHGSVNGYFLNENLFGTGKRLELRTEGSHLYSESEVVYTDPYARLDGVSRTIAADARRIDRLTVDSSALDTKVETLRLEYAYPLAPRRAADSVSTALGARPPDKRLAFGIAARHVDVAAGAAASEQLRAWVAAADGAVPGAADLRAEFTETELLLRWRDDTRDRVGFPTHGRDQTLDFSLALPGDGVGHYRIAYDATRYAALAEDWTLAVETRAGFGTGYGGGVPSQPPYLNWTAGGPATVRGYRDGSLGPRDSLGRPYGGNLLVAAQVELLTPWPARWRDRVRAGFFYDVGNVFETSGVAFADGSGAPLDYGFDAGALRQSAGLVAHVRIPLGLLSLSYARPLDAVEDGPAPFHRDEIERFQITLGVRF